MTREQHLEFCQKCTNRKMDFQKGLVCNLTNELATFENECLDFYLDDSVSSIVADENGNVNHNSIRDLVSEEKFAEYKKQQNLNMAIISGIIVGLVGAVLWCAITVMTNHQIGYMAIAIGAGVGIAMRYFGKGIDQIFGILGAVIAILSCFVGNFFSIVGYIANSEDLGYLETIKLIEYSQLMPIMAETFSVIDILFYGLAAYEGYKFSFRVFTQEELLEN